MSGHSKWATIKRKKEKTDAARGKVFTKIIKEITVAARMGGSDENANPRLKTAILNAKAANMPLDTMTRARLKGAGELPGVVLETLTYEGYGPGGVAVFIDANTDNKNRTVSEIRHAFAKCEGNLGENGSVGWMFHRKGVITIDAEGKDEDQMMEDAIEAGAEDVKTEDGMFEITTEYADFLTVCEELEKKYEFESSDITMIADNEVKVPSNKVKILLKMIEMLEDIDDVEDVYSNADIDEKDLEEM